jgi:hypothetical protein
MNSNLNRSSTSSYEVDFVWAKAAVKSVVDICGMNAEAVADGIFDTHIADMQQDVEFLKFIEFMHALRRGYRAIGIL